MFAPFALARYFKKALMLAQSNKHQPRCQAPSSRILTERILGFSEGKNIEHVLAKSRKVALDPFMVRPFWLKALCLGPDYIGKIFSVVTIQTSLS